MNIENSATKLSRNPLGIIALFILLIYGFATLLFGFIGKIFTDNQRWCFVIFLVSFPVLVLFIFTYLVVNYHQNLYAPGDYRDDKFFFYHASREEKEEQYENEIKKEQQISVDNRKQIERERRIDEYKEKTEKIENLVYEYYEKNYKYEIDKNIYYKISGKKIFFDGVIDIGETLILMKILYLQNNYISDIFFNISIINAIKVKSFLMGSGKYQNYRYKLLFTFVVDTSDITEINNITAKIQNMIDIDLLEYDIRVLSIKQLKGNL